MGFFLVCFEGLDVCISGRRHFEKNSWNLSVFSTWPSVHPFSFHCVDWLVLNPTLQVDNHHLWWPQLLGLYLSLSTTWTHRVSCIWLHSRYKLTTQLCTSFYMQIPPQQVLLSSGWTGNTWSHSIFFFFHSQHPKPTLNPAALLIFSFQKGFFLLSSCCHCFCYGCCFFKWSIHGYLLHL